MKVYTGAQYAIDHNNVTTSIRYANGNLILFDTTTVDAPSVGTAANQRVGASIDVHKVSTKLRMEFP